jgi:mannosyltransferase OCH1-like enzyme
MIPQVFHRIWFGPNPMPHLYQGFWGEWQRLHPDWQFKTWDYSNLPHLLNQPSFEDCGVKWPALSRYHDGIEQEVMRADIAAYDLIYQFGGVYLNCDLEPYKPITPLLEDVTAFAAWERPGFIGNAIFGATPHHPFFRDIIDALPTRVEHGWPMENATGTKLITNTYHINPHDLTLYDTDTLYDGDYVKHHWGHQLAVMGLLGDDVERLDNGGFVTWQ